jgi:hypothetical protein
MGMESWEYPHGVPAVFAQVATDNSVTALVVVPDATWRAALLTWRRGEAARVSLGTPSREVRYFNDLDEAAACAAAEVGTG